MDTVYIGLDLHKRSATFCVKTKDGSVLERRKCATSAETFHQYLRRFTSKYQTHLAFEPVHEWYAYADVFDKTGAIVHLANPLKVKAIADARIKTDTIDAEVLCDLLRGNLLPEAYYAPACVREWKELARTRASLIQIRTQAKNKIHALLAKCGVRKTVSGVFGAHGRQWLKSLSLPASFDDALDYYLSLVEHLDEQIRTCDKQVRHMADHLPEARLLMSIPGIGHVSALTIMAEIGDISRFANAKKLQSYAGLVPSVYSSGGHTRNGAITKQGSRWLRWILIEAAHHQIRATRVPGLAGYYRRMQYRAGTNTAAVATARKLCGVIWRVLTDEREYQPRLSQCSRMPAREVSSTPSSGK